MLGNLTPRAQAKLLVVTASTLLAFCVTACGFEPDTYRFSADFADTVAVPTGTDVHIGTEIVGEVVETSREDGVQKIDMEIDPDYAPIDSDAKAILRQGSPSTEIYVELTGPTGRGSPRAQD